MWHYILYRLMWIIPTLVGIITINFFIISWAPGGPIDQIELHIKHQNVSQGYHAAPFDQNNMGLDKLDQSTIDKLKKEFGFDQPLIGRYLKLLKNYAYFDFGMSFYKGKSVAAIITSALPVSLGITLLSLVFILLISIPLGVFKALKNGTVWDLITTIMIGISYAIPGFVFAIFFLIFFAGGSFWNWFPIRGIASDTHLTLTWIEKITDYLWHLCLPVTSVVLGHFARTVLMTKSTLIDEINKLYVICVQAKGASDHYILYKHCLKNALLTILSTIPYTFLNIFFYTTLMIEFVFSLNGIGYIGYEAIITRDYPVMFATIYLFALTSLVLLFVFDVLYHWFDPRVNISQKR